MTRMKTVRLLSSLLLASGSCTSAHTGAPPASTDSDPIWRTELVFERAVPLNACAIGDVDPRYPGNEIAAVTRNGEVLLAHLAQGTWTVETVARMPRVSQSPIIV